jgi:hypothetical protein
MPRKLPSMTGPAIIEDRVYESDGDRDSEATDLVEELKKDPFEKVCLKIVLRYIYSIKKMRSFRK